MRRVLFCNTESCNSERVPWSEPVPPPTTKRPTNLSAKLLEDPNAPEATRLPRQFFEDLNFPTKDPEAEELSSPNLDEDQNIIDLFEIQQGIRLADATVGGSGSGSGSQLNSDPRSNPEFNSDPKFNPEFNSDPRSNPEFRPAPGSNPSLPDTAGRAPRQRGGDRRDPLSVDVRRPTSDDDARRNTNRRPVFSTADSTFGSRLVPPTRPQSILPPGFKFSNRSR